MKRKLCKAKEMKVFRFRKSFGWNQILLHHDFQLYFKWRKNNEEEALKSRNVWSCKAQRKEKKGRGDRKQRYIQQRMCGER